jgi:excisionase family DNA binding protein
MIMKERPTGLVSIPEAALMLGLSELVMRKAVTDGQFPSVRVGSRRWVPVKALNQALEGPFELFPESPHN